jgi:hypothetical protein
MTKSQLLEELSHNSYVRLLPSAVHGIGVFAMRDIPKGCRDLFSRDPGEWHRLDFAEVEQLPAYSRQLIETYCLFDENSYFVPAHGFKQMDLSLFLNHGIPANIASVDEGAYFETLRDLRAGEDLLVDYGSLVDSDE